MQAQDTRVQVHEGARNVRRNLQPLLPRQRTRQLLKAQQAKPAHAHSIALQPIFQATPKQLCAQREPERGSIRQVSARRRWGQLSTETVASHRAAPSRAYQRVDEGRRGVIVTDGEERE